MPLLATLTREEILPVSFCALLESFSLATKRAVVGGRQGAHRSKKKGVGIEFADYQEYQLGDNPRAIDWGVYGRTDKLFVRRYHEEQNAHLLILLDSSSSMASVWQYATRMVAAISFLAVRSQDAVTVASPGASAPVIVQSPRGLQRMLSSLMNVQVAPAEGFVDFCKKRIAQSKLPGLVVVVSDFMFELGGIRSIGQSITARGCDGAFCMIDNLDDPFLRPQGTVQAIDSENGTMTPLVVDEHFISTYQQLREQHQAEVAQIARMGRLGFCRGAPRSPQELVTLLKSGKLAE